MTIRSPSLLAVLVAAGLAGPAAASAQWSGPEDVVGSGGASNVLTVAYGARGDALLVWSAQPGPFQGTANRPAGAVAWRTGPRLPRGMAYLQAAPVVALYGQARAVLVGPQRGGFGPTLRYRMIAAFGRSDGTFGKPTTLDSGISGRRAPHSLSTPAVAVNAAGEAVVAWSRDDGEASVIRLAERRAGGAFGPVTTISGEGARVPAVGVNAGRDRVVAWYRNGFVEARVRRAGRHGRIGDRPAVEVAPLVATNRFDPPTVVTGPDEPARPTDMVAGPRQRVAVVWERETTDSVLRSRVRAAIRLPGAGFGPAETLPVACRGTSICLPGDARAAFDPATGGLTAAWLQRDDAGYGVWAATRVAP